MKQKETFSVKKIDAVLPVTWITNPEHDVMCLVLSIDTHTYTHTHVSGLLATCLFYSWRPSCSSVKKESFRAEITVTLYHPNWCYPIQLSATKQFYWFGWSWLRRWSDRWKKYFIWKNKRYCKIFLDSSSISIHQTCNATSQIHDDIFPHLSIFSHLFSTFRLFLPCQAFHQKRVPTKAWITRKKTSFFIFSTFIFWDIKIKLL